MSAAAGRRRRRGALLVLVLLLLLLGMLLVMVCTGGSRPLTVKEVTVSWNQPVHAVDEPAWWTDPSVLTRPSGGDIVTLPADGIFASGSDVIAPGGAARIRSALSKVTSPKQASIICHTDSTGDDIPGLNQRLSESRALSVKKLVLTIPGFQIPISTAGRGSTQPKASNAIETGRTLNRRCEITIRIGA